MMNSTARRQAGLALMTTLIMLVVLTLLVLAAINMANVNTKVAYNMQLQNEAQASVQKAIEQTISNPANFNAPLPAPASIAVDLDNNGTADYTVTVPTPACVASSPIKQSQLNVANADDVPCFGTSSLQNAGIVGGTGSTGNSLCANTTWDVSGSYSDPLSSGLNLTHHQGVNVRVVAGTTC